ncbi:hypothetical protein ES703_124665 [subsurface metagenome]
MLCTNIIMAEVTCLIYSQFNDPLGSRGKPDFAYIGLLTTPDNEFHCRAHLAQAYTHVGEDLGCHAILFTD